GTSAPSGSITNVTDLLPNVIDWVVITSPNHGLTSGMTVTISGVNGVPGANGTWSISVQDANTFILTNSNFTGSYTGGGTWTAAASSPINAFLYDRLADDTTLISHQAGSTTTSGNGNTSTVAISADGSTVAFTSKAGNLLSAAGTAASNDQLYVWSRI